MLNVIKVRIYPNKNQQQKIHQTFGSVRLVYNLLLDAKIKAYECGDKLSGYDLKKRLVPMKNASHDGFLKEVDSTSLQNSILNLDKAYKNFFRRVKTGGTPGFPKFKSKHHSKQNYQTSTAMIKKNKLFLPKIGEIRSKFHRNVPIGKIKTVTVSFEAGQYFAAINYEETNLPNPKNNGKSIALDVGVKVFAYTSENQMIVPTKPHILQKDIEKMIKAQKSLSRKKKGSKNRLKAKKKLAKKHLKIRNKRDDFLHKASQKLSENQTIVVEDLKVKNMSKSSKGNLENPGKMVAQKSGLNRSILQQSWGRFFEFLEYKLERNGGKLVRVDPRFTSQKCSCCGHISKENRKNQAEFVCVDCGFTANADYNASLNILAAGTAVKAS